MLWLVARRGHCRLDKSPIDRGTLSAKGLWTKHSHLWDWDQWGSWPATQKALDSVYKNVEACREKWQSVIILRLKCFVFFLSLQKIKPVCGYGFSRTLMSRGMCFFSCSTFINDKIIELAQNKSELWSICMSRFESVHRDGFIRLKEEAVWLDFLPAHFLTGHWGDLFHRYSWLTNRKVVAVLPAYFWHPC